jgi:hypothetical protein
MLRIRIVTGGAIGFLLVAGLGADGASAQTASNETAGSPIQLLQLLRPTPAKTRPHARSAAKPVAKTRMALKGRNHWHPRIAARKRPQIAEEQEKATPPAGAWPPAPSIAPAEVAAAQAMPTLGSVPAETLPAELIATGAMMRVAAQGDVNGVDFAAKDAGAEPKAAQPIAAVARPSAINEAAAPAPKSDSLLAAFVQPQTSEVGSASWILQVLAALGGAVAAGSAAWFLIGSAPVRSYG